LNDKNRTGLWILDLTRFVKRTGLHFAGKRSSR
jgi:hypothetical protein